jgi:hypothetical protein
MASATLSGAYEHSNTEGTLGHSYVFAAQRIRRALEDRMNVMSLGIVPLVGEFAGSGSDTIRVTDFGGDGWGVAMSALATETDTVTPTPLTIGYETVTLGTYGLAHSETYTQQILSREPAILIDQIKGRIPSSWLRTFRQRVCVAGAGISGSVGGTGTTLSVDDHLDLRTAFQTTPGAGGAPTMILDPQQQDELARSWRNEPAMQNSSGDLAALLGLKSDGNGLVSQFFPNFAGMGIDIGTTDDVQQSGGAYQGFAFARGGIGWGVANTTPARPANRTGAIYVPQYGLLIEELTDGGRQTTRECRATAWFGVALASTRTHVLRRVLSTT